MATDWPATSYEQWRATCDTLHAHTQVLGKLATRLAPPEPEFQHAALAADRARLGDAPLPAPDGSGPWSSRWTCACTRRSSSTARAAERVPLTPDRPVGDVTRAVLATVAAWPARWPSTRRRRRCRGPCRSTRTTSTPSTTSPRSADYFAAATQAALVLAAYRAPYRGRSTPVNAWWGSFDLAVSLFSGLPADPPSRTSSCATRWIHRR